MAGSVRKEPRDLHRGEERTHICVRAPLLRKMRAAFASSVGDRFWNAKHCRVPIMRLGHALPPLLEIA